MATFGGGMWYIALSGEMEGLGSEGYEGGVCVHVCVC